MRCKGFWQTEMGKNLPGKENDGGAQWQKRMMCAQELAEAREAGGVGLAGW